MILVIAISLSKFILDPLKVGFQSHQRKLATFIKIMFEQVILLPFALKLEQTFTKTHF